MIEGLKIEISSGELKAHLDAKADFHSRTLSLISRSGWRVSRVRA